MKNIFTVLKEAQEFLTSHNITEAKIDAEVLLCDVLNIERKNLVTLRTQEITEEQYDKFQKYLTERITGKPVAYITGVTEFMGLKFNVTPDILIPRQETEILVEKANDIIKKNNFKTCLDLCTGSGCIAVSVACFNENISVTASDISIQALKTARHNAGLNNVTEKINFICSDIFENIKGKFDIILSNPPYVTEAEYKCLQKELYFEPKLALTAPDNGLYFYKLIAQKAKNYLNENGVILLELNSGLSEQIKDLFKDFSRTQIIKDYSGLDRILKIEMRRK